MQHVKNKYGKGIEVEVKTQMPSKEDIELQVQPNFPLGTRLNKQQLQTFLGLYPKVSEQLMKGQGSHITDDVLFLSRSSRWGS